jgi:hypothetical protein
MSEKCVSCAVTTDIHENTDVNYRFYYVEVNYVKNVSMVFFLTRIKNSMTIWFDFCQKRSKHQKVQKK